MEGWHVDKKVSLGHIIMTVSVVTGLFVWGGDIDKRIQLLEYQQGKQEEFNGKIEDYFSNIVKKLDEITEKFAEHKGEHNGK